MLVSTYTHVCSYLCVFSRSLSLRLAHSQLLASLYANVLCVCQYKFFGLYVFVIQGIDSCASTVILQYNSTYFIICSEFRARTKIKHTRTCTRTLVHSPSIEEDRIYDTLTIETTCEMQQLNLIHNIYTDILSIIINVIIIFFALVRCVFFYFTKTLSHSRSIDFVNNNKKIKYSKFSFNQS